MIKNLKFSILLLIIFISKISFSQEQSMSFSACYGFNKLISDVSSKASGSGGMGFYYNPISSLDLGFTFNVGNFHGEQSDFVYQSTTGVKFLTNFFDYGIKVKYNLYSLIDPNPYAKISFYISTGLGYIEFRDRLENLNGEFIEGFGYENAGNAKPKTTTEIYVPISLGFKYRYDKNYSLAFEPAFVWCNTDKLDYVKLNKKDYYFLFPLILEYKLYFNNVK